MNCVSFSFLIGCFASLLFGVAPSFAQDVKETEPTNKIYEGTPLKVLIVTGGCCHNYPFQTGAITNGLGAQMDVEFTVVNKGGNGTSAMIDLYDKKGWADGYDAIIHNECFAKTTDADYIKRVVAGHGKAGKPAVVIHCAMHTYRDAQTKDWQQFLGVTSKHHEHQGRYPVKVLKPGHPALIDFPSDWVTPKDELYIIEKVWPGAVPLATSKSEKSGKEHPVIWVNDHKGTRVFGTTYGHSDDTFRDPVFIDLIARGLVWATEDAGWKIVSPEKLKMLLGESEDGEGETEETVE